MRFGFTTGSCAAAAAKAAAYMLLTGKQKQEITIETPKGIPYQARIESIHREETRVSCAVKKDGGDDPDITTGAFIVATVELESGKALENVMEEPDLNFKDRMPAIRITGGKGVGKVTKPGLDQPVGNAAINHVPREMIRKEVTEICMLTDYHGGLLVEISVPKGETLAAKTFNPRLGITGGISILGTTGIVEPMSSAALLETIRAELSQKRALGARAAAVSPGNYGLDFMKKTYGFDLDRSVKCSNFIGDTIDMAVELGFTELLLTGHIGKLVKLSGGIMNTHSKEGDCRSELMAAAALRAGCGTDILSAVLESGTTEEALLILKKRGAFKATMEQLTDKIMFYLKKRAADKVQVECILYASSFGELAKSDGAEELLKKIKKAGY